MTDDFEKRVLEAVEKIGMVYVLRDDLAGAVKIGTALNPLKRLRDLQTGSSVPLRLIAMFPGGRKGEREFHDLYRGRRLAGEWFDDRDEHMSEILIKVAESSGIVWPQR